MILMVSLSSKGMPGRHPWPSTIEEPSIMRRTTLDTLLSVTGAALISYGLAALALAGSGIALIRRHQITHDTTTAPKVEQITTA